MKSHTIVYIAAGLSFLATSLMLALVPIIYQDVETISERIEISMIDFKYRTDLLWHDLVALAEMSRGFIRRLPRKRSYSYQSGYGGYTKPEVDLTLCYCSLEQQYACPPGPPGLPGNRGYDGIDGQNGLSGVPGINWDEFIEYLQKCVVCPVGKPGLPGKYGLPGKPGAPGLPGPPAPYVENPPGDEGPKGLPGSPGKRGQPGRKGTDGSLGIFYTKGKTGAKGEHGPSGPPGLPGRNGNPSPAIGEPGQSGLPGLPGKVGNTGYPGLRGPVGPPGMPGNDAAYCNCPKPTSQQGSNYGKVVSKYVPNYGPINHVGSYNAHSLQTALNNLKIKAGKKGYSPKIIYNKK